ncbi:MAG: OB-fold domain-containing protein [Actinobacteria bacterium]|nr:OB-fold domain-containing protein [Actinomycetota bacterium]
MRNGIIAYGAYLPYWLLARSTITEALGIPAGKGGRTVASYDEDTTTMAVEAAREAITGMPYVILPNEIILSTTAPAYMDKTNAAALHDALSLPRSVSAFDMSGSVRSSTAAMRYATYAPVPVLVVLSDMRNGLPGSVDEREGGDAAVAFLFGSGPDVIAEPLAYASVTSEFLERWKLPGEKSSHQWEERFGEHKYVPLAIEAMGAAMKEAGVTASEIDHLIVTGTNTRAVKAVQRSGEFAAEVVAEDLTDIVGYSGSAHQGLVLANVLDTSEPGAVILAVSIADGAEATIFRVREHIVEYRQRRSNKNVAACLDPHCHAELPYMKFLTWRNYLQHEQPRRPEPTPPAPPPAARHATWKFGFTASRCNVCGTRLMPPGRVCIRCGAVDQMTGERLADVEGIVANFTIDRLTFTPNPPMVAAIVDFDGGGRFRCELTDVDPNTVAIGDRVEMTFRKITTSQSIHNYFWKARPIREEVR